MNSPSLFLWVVSQISSIGSIVYEGQNGTSYICVEVTLFLEVIFSPLKLLLNSAFEKNISVERLSMAGIKDLS